jgi:Spy/CpxP family protein refolding chaperone
MHPGFIFWWKSHRRGQAFGAYPHHGAGAGPGFVDPGQVSGGGGGQPQQPSRPGPTYHAAGDACDYGAGLGVRRPLRFLAYKLQLSDTQVGELARIISELKTERAQAEVDDRRVVSALADAISGGSFDEAKANAAAKQRVQSTERVQEAVVKSLGRIHALLNEEQRAALGYLIRTGTLAL